MKQSTGKPTKYEQKRIDAMLRLGCMPCAQLSLWVVPECHHIVEGNKRKGHWFTLPICPGHHRGVWSPEQIEVIPPDLRVAISDGSKVFEKVYGSQRDMWMKLQRRLKLPAIWPITKILPRRLGHVESNNNGMANVLGLVRLPPAQADEPRAVEAVASGDGTEVSRVHGPATGGEAQ